jgi:hypothetical protein
VADERDKTGLMVFVVKPLLLSSLEGSFLREIKEIVMRAGLDADTTNNFSLSCTLPIFHKEIVLEEWKIRADNEIALT